MIDYNWKMLNIIDFHYRTVKDGIIHPGNQGMVFFYTPYVGTKYIKTTSIFSLHLSNVFCVVIQYTPNFTKAI